MWNYDQAVWRENTLYAKKLPIMRLEPEGTCPGMWIVVRPDGTRSDMMNKVWAMHTARTWALSILNTRERVAEGDPGASNPNMVP